MKNKFALFCLMILLSVPGVSAAQLSMGLSLNIGIPQGSFSDTARGGYGITPMAYYQIAPNTGLTLKLGAIRFEGEREEIDETTVRDIGYSDLFVKLGARHFLVSDFYGIAEIGIHDFITNIEYTKYTTPLLDVDGNNTHRTKFGFSSGIGYERKMGIASIDACLQYQYLEKNTSYIGFRCGIKIF